MFGKTTFKNCLKLYNITNLSRMKSVIFFFFFSLSNFQNIKSKIKTSKICFSFLDFKILKYVDAQG